MPDVRLAPDRQRTRTERLEGHAICRHCDWYLIDSRALAEAAKHHDDTGHTTVTALSLTVTYGNPSARRRDG